MNKRKKIAFYKEDYISIIKEAIDLGGELAIDSYNYGVTDEERQSRINNFIHRTKGMRIE